MLRFLVPVLVFCTTAAGLWWPLYSHQRDTPIPHRSQTIWRRLKQPSQIEYLADYKKKLANVCGDVELRDVCFAYGTRPEKSIFTGLSLKIGAGQFVGIAGSRESSTALIHLLGRLCDPSDGTVMLDGADVRLLNVRWLRQQLGVVARKPVLFAGTVRANIAYGKESASLAEIEGAAKAAGAHSFISTLRDAYETVLDLRGESMSCGQQQLIALARAVVREPSVMLLDEPMADISSEHGRPELESALERLTMQRQERKQTTVISAEAPCIPRHVNKIVVLREGRIVDTGTWNELLGTQLEVGTRNEFNARQIWRYHV